MLEDLRYTTTGVALKIPDNTMQTIGQLIEDRKDSGAEIDVLQIFRLYAGKNAAGKAVQLIEHVQEQPPYRACHVFDVEDEPLEAKIFIIDTLCQTLLLVERL